jgi:hypothetical protein
MTGRYKDAIPAIVMLAGAAGMIAPGAPGDVREGGACLLAVAMILADLQSGRKLGYTDKILSAVRKAPGLEKVDEGTLLGLFTMGASAILATAGIKEMVQHGHALSGGIKAGINMTCYPGAAAASFQGSREWLEGKLGRQMVFEYRDVQGKLRKTAPVSTIDLLQQCSLLLGGTGVFSYGVATDLAGVEVIGLLFAASNLMNIATLTSPPLKEAAAEKLLRLKRMLEATPEEATAEQHRAKLREQWEELRGQLAPGKSQEPIDFEGVQRLARRAATAAAATINEAWRKPAEPAR